MDILLVEPYFAGSHAAWASGYRAHSRHGVEVLSLPGSSWKWRMHGGAVALARRLRESGRPPDLVLATDMLDVAAFQGLTRRETARVPFVTYFHENQLTYPWSPHDRDVDLERDRHYAFINYTTALASDAVFFNSAYHRDSFLDALAEFLPAFPDHAETGNVARIRERSAVLPLALDLRRFDAAPPRDAGDGPPLVLWNHRWEYDKNPEAFFAALERVAARGVAFRVAVLGERFERAPAAFEAARERLGERVAVFGYAEDTDEYAAWLQAADVLAVTANQDFFGASVVEAVYCGCRPLLPRRLAYPELIPAAFHDEVFYDDDDDLARRLDEALRSPRSAPEQLRDAMARYDWSVRRAEYDDRLDAVWERRHDA